MNHRRHQIRMCLVWRLAMGLQPRGSLLWSLASCRLKILQEGFLRALLSRRVTRSHTWDAHVQTFDAIAMSRTHCEQWQATIVRLQQQLERENPRVRVQSKPRDRRK